MTRIPTKLKPWFEARRRFKLSHAHTQMARELGMNPRKLGSLADGGQEPWKLPLPEFIVECYRKSFGRSEPEHVRSLEEVVQAEERRRKEKQARKAEEMVIPAGSAQSAVPATRTTGLGSDALPLAGAWFCFRFVPETKGVPLERIERDLHRGRSLRQLGAG